MSFIRNLPIIAFCFLCSASLCANERPGGILFASGAKKLNERTSLMLFSDNPHRFENAFTFEFDLSIWDPSQYGHIFRAINERRQEVEFVFVNFYGIDNMYLDFHSPITHTSVQIPITKQDIEQKKDFHISIHFDLKNDLASIEVEDSVYTCTPVGLENPSHLQFVFGLFRLNLDVPQMLISNLHIREEAGQSFFFPLSESRGDFAYDKTGKIKADVKNPEWMINKHYYWQEQTTLLVDGRAPTSFDEQTGRIIIHGPDSALLFYPRHNRLERAKIPNEIPFSDQRQLRGNVFRAPTGEFFHFGGYDSQTYSDRVFHYHPEDDEWKELDFKGDRITPRSYTAVGEGVRPNEKLIFGGFGNETGKQEHSGRNLYDLYRLNMKQQTITNVWRLHEILPIEFIPGNNLILSDNKQYFYAFCYAHHLAETFGYLYRFDLHNGKYDLMSDPVHFASEGVNNTSVNLFYSRTLREFYLVIRDFSALNETRVRIYSLLSPPITETQLKNIPFSLRLYRTLIWIIALFVLLASTLLTLRHLYERRNRTTLSRLPNEEDYYKKRRKQSAIYTFGQFTVYDKNGNDMTHRFSTKLKVLFALILLNTKPDSGLSTEKLTQIMWPDKNINEAKGARSVIVARLRNILEDIGGITLVHQNHSWFYTYDNDFHCDYLEYSQLMARIEQSDRKTYPLLMEQLHVVVRTGAFLSSVHDAGIDPYKSQEEEKLERLLKEYIHYLYMGKHYPQIIPIATTFFAVEPLNEEILNICLKAYDKAGKKEEAATFLKNYKRTYNLMTGEEYNL
jgi:two-component SAPR family response regulator